MQNLKWVSEDTQLIHLLGGVTSYKDIRNLNIIASIESLDYKHDAVPIYKDGKLEVVENSQLIFNLHVAVTTLRENPILLLEESERGDDTLFIVGEAKRFNHLVELFSGKGFAEYRVSLPSSRKNTIFTCFGIDSSCNIKWEEEKYSGEENPILLHAKFNTRAFIGLIKILKSYVH